MSEVTDGETTDVKISRDESFWLWMLRRNAATPVVKIERTWNIWNLRVRFSWRSRKNLWGRFGGGWNWKVGFTAGGSTMILHLLVAEFIVSRIKRNQQGLDQ